MLKIGDKIPNLDLITHKGEKINLNDFKGKKIVLFFYPRANTPGCTAEACNLNDNYSNFKNKGYEIIGVSPDEVKKQNSFAEKFGFKYNLIADDSKKLIEAFGVWGKKKFRGKEYFGVMRTTFIINEDGLIERIIEKVNTKEHSFQILEEDQLFMSEHFLFSYHF